MTPEYYLLERHELAQDILFLSKAVIRVRQYILDYESAYKKPPTKIGVPHWLYDVLVVVNNKPDPKIEGIFLRPHKFNYIAAVD